MSYFGDRAFSIERQQLKERSLLIDKAKQVFRDAGKDSIFTGEGLTRKELRKLERLGVVKKFETYKDRKYTTSAPCMIYIWELV